MPCAQAPPRDLALPVLRPPAVKHSKAGRRRAAVLIGVHLLVAVHVAQWIARGTTLSPLEPSESMEFSKQSIVNAGLIFFALTILSTLVLGRWFCGWACHVVALQDLSRWILARLGLRPKPARLGILATIPLAAFAYMFLAPPVHRLLHGAAAPPVTLHLTTDAFWATFPSWLPAVLTLFTCGFVAVYFLGSKGFCTYGCPYGAIFGIADHFAPGRIRVTDACEGCGHCTSVCSSNVRVHEEVRDFGMVVDPGCMKCLDCVSVCPNDALYFGFGPPALGAQPRTPPRSKPAPQRSTQRPKRRARRGAPPAPAPAHEQGQGIGAAAAHWALTGAFLLSCYALFMWHDGNPEWRVAAVLTAGSLAVLALLRVRGGSRRVVEHSLGEQAMLGALFLGGVLAFRGLYGLVPFLFSLGLAAVLAYLGVAAIRLLYRRDEAIHRWRLKRGGRLQPAGAVFAALMLGVTAVAVHGGMTQLDARRGAVAVRYLGAGIAAGNLGRMDDAREALTAALRLDDELAEAWYHLGVVESSVGHDAAAIAAYERAVFLEPRSVDARENLAGMYCQTGRFREGIAQFERALRDRPDDPRTHELLARAHRELKQWPQAEAHARRALAIDPRSQVAPALLAAIESQRGPQGTGSVEDEVRDNLLNQVVGDGRVRDLAMPDPLLRRAVDRVIRDSWRQKWGHSSFQPPVRGSESRLLDPAGAVPTVAQPLETRNVPISRYRAWLLEGRPALPGFRAPILGAADTRPPVEPPPAPPDGEAALRSAARIVVERLAREGLLATTADVVQFLGAARLAAQPDGGRALLASIGLPVDLLDQFDLAGGPATASPGAAFRFRQSRDGFSVATEEGAGEIAMLRLQLTRGDDERGPDDGGCLDIARQVVAALPGAEAYASIEEGFGAPALPRPCTLAVEALPVSQWAQDNGKPGWVDGAIATIVPRYASRREDGSVFVPGDSFLADGLLAMGLDVFQSPLLFQGGSVMAVRDPASGTRILLLGEAEVARNIALGLSAEQVLEAFTIEFGVDRCVVLPAVSYHLDWDVTVRAVDGKLVAFVNDTAAAARIILGAGVEALGVLGAGDAAAAGADLAAHRDLEFVRRMRPAVTALPADEPVMEPANFTRFLAALDVLSAMVVPAGELAKDRHGEAYFRSLRRRAADERELQDRLAAEGFRVVPIPSFADDDRSVNMINGIQAPDRYLMPAWGGLYEPLDRAAAAAFEAAFGPSVQVVPIRSALSQERVGAVHCSVSACSRP